MSDKLTQEQRSLLMGRVRQRGTGPELLLRKNLWKAGIRYRLKTKEKLPGSPDLIFQKARIAVFVDGCFWHGCPFHGTFSKTHPEFWFDKISRNKERDMEVDSKLSELGWYSIRFWEHDLKKNMTGCIEKLINHLRSR
jgi:DNA mismatch endonuclease, patch repair protein